MIAKVREVYIVLFALIGLCFCTMDLNFKEIQYVAGELTTKECRKLAEALHNKQLFPTEDQKLTGSHEPNKTCLFLLLKYDRTEGKGKTFLDMEIRLRQIGRKDLADRLSKKVYHEKALAIKEKFLDDPFKQMIPKHSFLVEDEKQMIKTMKAEKEEGFDWETFWIVMSILSLITLFFCSFRILCPRLGSSLWRRLASETAIEFCDLCDDECTRCWKKFKLNYERYVVGNEKVVVFIEDEEKLLKEASMMEIAQNERLAETVLNNFVHIEKDGE